MYVYIYMNKYEYIYIVPPLGAYKSQLGGTYILLLLVYMVNVYCDYTSIYMIIYVYSSCHLIVGVFARQICQMHSTNRIRNDSSEQVRVSEAGGGGRTDGSTQPETRTPHEDGEKSFANSKTFREGFQHSMLGFRK